MNPVTLQRASVVPSLRYRNAPAAIDWLCGVLGFERHAVDPGEGGRIVDQEYASRGFTCRDPEGYVWSVGTYDPWSGEGTEG